MYLVPRHEVKQSHYCRQLWHDTGTVKCQVVVILVHIGYQEKNPLDTFQELIDLDLQT